MKSAWGQFKTAWGFASPECRVPLIEALGDRLRWEPMEVTSQTKVDFLLNVVTNELGSERAENPTALKPFHTSPRSTLWKIALQLAIEASRRFIHGRYEMAYEPTYMVSNETMIGIMSILGHEDIYLRGMPLKWEFDGIFYFLDQYRRSFLAKGVPIQWYDAVIASGNFELFDEIPLDDLLVLERMKTYVSTNTLSHTNETERRRVGALVTRLMSAGLLDVAVLLN